MAKKIGPQKASAAFSMILEKLGRDDLSDILTNWNDSELSEDGTTIFCYVGRDRQYSRGANGGKSSVSKKEFIEWLLSNGPLDENEYGALIRKDTEWTKRIEMARAASGLLIV